MKIIDLEIESPAALANGNGLPLWTEFFFPIYQNLYDLVNPASQIYPHINFDTFHPFVLGILNALDPVNVKLLGKLGKNANPIIQYTKGDTNKAMMIFLWHFPQFSNLLSNIHLLPSVALKSSQIYLNLNIDSINFIHVKQFVDQMNRDRWLGRAQKYGEQQSGKVNLGNFSESLLEIAMEHLIDNTNFFKNTNQKVQSYGDFVLMCLPNNLWISVKSNFARERLLASGYTTDILGVGFFQDMDEFTSTARIRNFQRVGFLAMYLPDIPISEAQIISNTNTYQEVQDYYIAHGIPLPRNINGTLFLRRLSGLHEDISAILDETDIQKRTTLSF